MTVKTPAQLQAQYQATLADNASGDISPADVRNAHVDTTNTWDALKVDNTEDSVARWNANKLQGENISTTTPGSGDIWQYDTVTFQWYPTPVKRVSGGLSGFVDNVVITPIVTIDTPVVVNQPTWSLYEFGQFTSPSNGRFTYVGANTAKFKVWLSVSFFVSSNNRASSIYVGKNGVALGNSKASMVTLTGEASETSTFTIVELANNDYLEVFVENNENTDDITCEHMHLMFEEVAFL